MNTKARSVWVDSGYCTAWVTTILSLGTWLEQVWRHGELRRNFDGRYRWCLSSCEEGGNLIL